VAETQEAVGLVRHYDYVHPAGYRIRCTTGSRSDYWTHLGMSRNGYSSTLEAYVDGLLSTVKPADT
jgi:hypothetical protein